MTRHKLNGIQLARESHFVPEASYISTLSSKLGPVCSGASATGAIFSLLKNTDPEEPFKSELTIFL